MHKVTLSPGAVTEADIEDLRTVGIQRHRDPRSANNRTAHLNYTNRIANGLGLLTRHR